MKLYNITLSITSNSSSCVKDLTMVTYTLDNIKKAIKNALEKQKDLNNKYIKIEVLESVSREVILKLEFNSKFGLSLFGLLNE